MKTVMIVGAGLGLGVQQMIHLILAPFSPHTVTILSLTFLSFAFHAVFSAFQAPLNYWDGIRWQYLWQIPLNFGVGWYGSHNELTDGDGR